MTAEKTYALCCDALRAAAAQMEQPENAFIEMFEKQPAACAGAHWFPVLAALAPIMQDAREQMDKAHSPAAVLQAVKRIAKAATRENLRGGWIDEEGRYCVCSGYHAARLAGARFDSVPTVPAFDGLKDCMKRPEGLHRFDPPTVAECKAWRATHGKNKPMPVDEGRRYVNAAYMLDMLQALPGATWYASSGALAPMWCDTERGDDGILLPVRLPRAAEQ